ncbi:MAG TPA: undecaprenyl-diphosphate phosphatase [Alphaproteobacteria bacterium]|nr:undecaprenyl-diphosphate phosphatase [Alphaproteobacteria bacterium]
MPLYHILILALVQGITEFLPISSSGHLVLVHRLLGNTHADLCWETDRLMDVSVHVGTLFAVLVYFRRDIFSMLGGITKPKSTSFGLMINLIIASVPVIIAGFVIHKIEPSFICMIEIMAWMTVIFGFVLWFADKFDSSKKLEEMNFMQALIVGASQALALIPGVSRSGITMTSARFLGFSRVESARFSLLLSIVAISGAGFLTSLDLLETGDLKIGIDVMIGVGLSFISGLIAISLMMKWLSKATFTPFAIYRVILGIVLLALIYGGML